MLFFYDTNGKFNGSSPFDLVNLPTTFPTNLPADLPTSCFSYQFTIRFFYNFRSYLNGIEKLIICTLSIISPIVKILL